MNTFTIFINRTCNLACDYCFVKKDDNIMTSDVINTLVDFTLKHKSSKEPLLKIVGGEPLLSLDSIEYLFKTCSQKGLKAKFRIITNGTIYNKQVEDLIKKNNHRIDGIVVSFDGLKTIQDKNRKLSNGKSSFSIIKKNIEKIRKIYPALKACTRAPINKNSNLLKRVKSLYSLGFKEIHLEPIFLDVNDKNFREFYSQLKELSDWYIKQIKSGKSLFISFLGGIKEKLGPVCAFKSMICIDTDGTIYPCAVYAGARINALGTVYNFNKARRDLLIFYLRQSNKHKRNIICPARNYLANNDSWKQNQSDKLVLKAKKDVFSYISQNLKTPTNLKERSSKPVLKPIPIIHIF